MIEDLKSVVEHYHREPPLKDSDEALDEMREMGVAEEEIERLQENEEQEQPYEVLPENWPAVQLYVAVYGQFNVTASGYILGFDPVAVRNEREWGGIKISRKTWKKFKYLQQLTATLLNERNKTSHE